MLEKNGRLYGMDEIAVRSYYDQDIWNDVVIMTSFMIDVRIDKYLKNVIYLNCC